jgi:hypothetical protein
MKIARWLERGGADTDEDDDEEGDAFDESVLRLGESPTQFNRRKRRELEVLESGGTSEPEPEPNHEIELEEHVVPHWYELIGVLTAQPPVRALKILHRTLPLHEDEHSFLYNFPEFPELGTTVVDPALWQCRQLNRLELSLPSEVLRELPTHGIGRLLALEELILSENALENLPQELELLTRLRVLELSVNRLTKLPEAAVWQGLQMLEVLDLSKNQLTDEALANLCPSLQSGNVTCLKLDGNMFTSLQLPWSNMKHRLSTLCARDNQIVELQEQVVLCTRLTTLDLGQNAITSLPLGLRQLHVGPWQSFNLNGNPFTDDPDARRII